RGGALTVGADPAEGASALGALRAVRLHCEVEIEEPAAGDAATAGAAQAFQPGQTIQVGTAQLRFVPMPEEPAAEDSALDNLSLAGERAAEAAPPPTSTKGLDKRLLVIDGADQGRSYSLNTYGKVNIGKSSKHCDIVLHDL